MTETALFQFFGRLHPLLLHLPIGLWIGIAFLEFGGTLIRRRAPRATIATLAWLAGIGGAITATAGWVLSLEDYSGRTLELHRWLGVAAGGAGLLAAAFASLQARRPFQLLLLLEVGTLMAAGHFGSELTHTDTWLTAPFEQRDARPKPPAQQPQPTATPMTPPPSPDHLVDPVGTAFAQQSALAQDPGKPATEPAVAANPTRPAQTAPAGLTFAASVLPILEQRCAKCHGANKQKGKLALHTQAAIEAGGENGPVLAAGKPDDSELVRRILLPLDDEDHMPPKEKAQPTAAEVAVLRGWIAAGGPFTAPFVATTEPVPTVPTDPASTTPPHQPAPAAAPAKAAPVPAAPIPAAPIPAAPIPATPVPAAPVPAAPVPAAPIPATPVPAAPIPATPVPATPAPVEPVQPRPAQPAPAQPDPGRPGGGTAAAPTPAHDPALEAGIAALRRRLVHVAPVAAGSSGLWVDFAPIAASMTETEARTLLTPVAAQVVELGLARVPVGDDLMAVCARMPMLHRLDLGRTRVTSRGVAALQRHAQLQQLVLAETRLDDHAVDALLQMPSLRKVYLWNAGVGPDALARLRERQDLSVDAGESVAAAALETEPPPFDASTASSTPASAEPAVAATTTEAPAEVPAALRPINDVCPVSGKPVDARFVVVHDGRAVGFCCPNCPKTFWAEPARFPVAAR